MSEKPTEEQLRKLLAQWAERLNLLHWRFAIVVKDDIEAIKGEADASVVVSEDYNVATIEISSEWTEWSVPKLQHVIVHELLHCHFEPLWHATLTAEDALGDQAASLFAARVLHELELAIDSVAHAIITNWGLAPA